MRTAKEQYEYIVNAITEYQNHYGTAIPRRVLLSQIQRSNQEDRVFCNRILIKTVRDALLDLEEDGKIRTTASGLVALS